MMPKAKRAKSSNAKLKSMSLFYNKVCELVSLLGDLVDIQALTDTDILQVPVLFHNCNFKHISGFNTCFCF